MSFILDALKKSETERQRQGSAEFVGVPTKGGPAAAPRWLWVLGLLLAINLAVLLGLLLRPDASPQLARGPVEADTPITLQVDAPATETSFMERVAEARQNAPARQEETPAPQPLPEPAPVQQVMVAESASDRAAANLAALPTFIEVIANGSIELPDLHLDIHVYSEVPEDRFVFINMSKQREQSQLSEGPVVEEITPNGVVLSYLDTRFLLPRD